MSEEIRLNDTVQIEARDNKDKEKKDATEESMKVRCKTCFKEISPQRVCGGHGGGGGGDTGEDEEPSEEQAAEYPSDQNVLDHAERGKANEILDFVMESQ